MHHYNISLSLHDDNALTDYCIAQVYIETSRFELALPRFEKIMKGHGIGFAGYNTFALFVDYGFTLVILKRYHHLWDLQDSESEGSLVVVFSTNQFCLFILSR